MPVTECYLDTSVLIKLFVDEKKSTEVENFAAKIDRLIISRLSTLEWHCAMERRFRAGTFSASYLRLAKQEFTRQIAEGYFQILAVSDAQFSEAIGLLKAAKPTPLRALDALHLSAALMTDAKRIATADKVMIDAAKRLGLKVENFLA